MIDERELTKAEEKQGHWKCYKCSRFVGFDDNYNPTYRDTNVYRCSECNRKTVIQENYCPNCGAKMEPWKGEQE